MMNNNPTRAAPRNKPLSRRSLARPETTLWLMMFSPHAFITTTSERDRIKIWPSILLAWSRSKIGAMLLVVAFATSDVFLS